jgi:hypothetical protein
LFNPALVVDGDGVWHLLIETKKSGENFTTMYSYATMTDDMINFDTNISASPVFSGYSGNPFMVYVPDRDRILAVYGDCTSGIWVIRASYANPSEDLTLAANWHIAPRLVIQRTGVHLADPTMVFAPDGLPWKCKLDYNYNQIDGYGMWGSLGLTDFYDAAIAPL